MMVRLYDRTVKFIFEYINRPITTYILVITGHGELTAFLSAFFQHPLNRCDALSSRNQRQCTICISSSKYSIRHKLTGLILLILPVSVIGIIYSVTYNVKLEHFN